MCHFSEKTGDYIVSTWMHWAVNEGTVSLTLRGSFQRFGANALLPAGDPEVRQRFKSCRLNGTVKKKKPVSKQRMGATCLKRHENPAGRGFDPLTPEQCLLY